MASLLAISVGSDGDHGRRGIPVTLTTPPNDDVVVGQRGVADDAAPGARGARPAGLKAKRAFDLLVGIPLCFGALPVIAVLALILAVQHRGDPFFVHHRIGHRGRSTPIPKLRTLSPDTPAYADKTVVTLQTHSRFASALRKLHLDELPQLLLVPPGQLSLVGPRPRMATEAVNHDDLEYEATRTSVPQGCTGLWQVSVGKVGRVSDHPEYDLFYVANRTLRLDVWILWRTALQTLGANPIALCDVPPWTLPKSRITRSLSRVSCN